MKNLDRTNLRKQLGIVAFFFLAPLVFYFNFWYENAYWAPSDSLFTGVPGMQLWKEKIFEGFTSLLWNQYVESGYPFLPDIQNEVCYPFRLLFLLLPPITAYNYLLLLHFTMAGGFVYLYLRSIGCSRSTSLIAGSIAMFAPTTNLRIVHPTVIFTIVWVPLVLYFLEKNASTNNKKYLVLAALAFTCQLYACFFQVVCYSGILYIAYIFFRLGSESTSLVNGFRKAAVASFIFGGLWLSTTLFLILPTYEISEFVGRRSMSLKFFTGMSLHPWSLATYLNSQSLGDQKAFLPEENIHEFGALYPLFDVTTQEHQLYIGVVSLFIAIYSLRFICNDRRLVFWWVVWIFTIVFALGGHLPVFANLFYRIPVLSSFRVPARILFLSTFAVIFLFAITLDRIENGPDRQSEWRRLWYFLILACIVSFLFLGNLLMLQYQIIYRISLSDLLFHYRVTNYKLYLSPLFLLAATSTVGRALRTTRMSMIAPCFGLILIADLWTYVFPINSSWFNHVTTSDIVRFLKENETETDRHLLLCEQNAPIYSLKERATGLTPWFNASHHLPSIVGYETFVKNDYFEGQANLARIPNLDFHLTDNRLFSRLGMKHLIIRRDSEYVDFLRQHCREHYKEVAEFDDFYVFENVQSLPRFHCATRIRSLNDEKTEKEFDVICINDEPGSFKHELAPAIIEKFEYSPGRATVFLRGLDESFVVFAENFYPGWNVTIDGQPTKLHHVDKIYMGTFVPPGNHTITFYYFPKTVGIGLVCLALGIVLYLVLYFYWDAKYKTNVPIPVGTGEAG